MSIRPASRLKDPNATLDFEFDWSAWIPDGDTIATVDVTVESGDVVIDSMSNDDTTVTVWLSGGTVGTQAGVRCRITTTQGRKDDRTGTLFIRQR